MGTGCARCLTACKSIIKVVPSSHYKLEKRLHILDSNEHRMRCRLSQHSKQGWATPYLLGSLLLLTCTLLSADELDNPALLPPAIKPATNTPPVRVALVDSGVNYQLPQINARLARAEDGKLIGYDFWDMDGLPFDSHPNDRGGVQRHGTRTASLLIKEAPFVELVPYRYPRPDMQRMSDLIVHAEKHGVRIIGLPLGGNRREQWTAFEQAASAHPHILFIASAGNNGRDIDQQPVFPASLPLANMLVVTSADDFGRVAEGVNWGRVSVDYMVPAEQLVALQFDGSEARVAGSSYAVPRAMALAARFLRDAPTLDVPELLAQIRRHFANGFAPRQLAHGYLNDPGFDPQQSIATRPLASYVVQPSELLNLLLPLQVLILDEHWQTSDVTQLLAEAGQILAQCGIAFDASNVMRVEAPEYLSDLETGSAKTLMDAVRQSGPHRKLTIVMARDTRMNIEYDAEAFGQGNTRNRPWMTHSVWLTLALEDRAIALAHELFHVLVNSGDHSVAAGSLMLARTTGKNTRLTMEECATARQRGNELGLLRAP